MAAATSAEIISTLDALDTALDAVAELSWDALGCGELVAVLSRLEQTARRLPVPSHAILARMSREASSADFDGTPLSQALAERLRISAGEARRRLGDAAVLAPRVGLTGDILPPMLEHTAAAQALGAVGREQVAVIRDVMDRLPRSAPATVVADAEAQLARYATQFRPEVLRKIGRRILDTVAPDGVFDERDRARRRGITLGGQQADGMSRLTGWITPEARATIDAVLSKWAAPGMCNPDDSTACVSGTPSTEQITNDCRSGAQRTHDAVLAMCRSVLSSGELGRHHGLPVTVIVSTTLADLEAAAGHGVTAGGTLLPVSDVSRMASHAYHYLCIFDSSNEKPLNLFRTKRCASEAQRIVLHANDRGCTFPGCTAPAYLCEVHHIDEYGPGGDTNIDVLTLACRPHHRLVKPGGWGTRKRPDGRTEWIPPPDSDTGRPTVNDYHHPERLWDAADGVTDPDPPR